MTNGDVIRTFTNEPITDEQIADAFNEAECCPVTKNKAVCWVYSSGALECTECWLEFLRTKKE